MTMRWIIFKISLILFWFFVKSKKVKAAPVQDQTSGLEDDKEQKFEPRISFISPQEAGNILIGFFDQTFSTVLH